MKARGDLGHALSKQGKHAEAIVVFEACLADLETLTDPQPWQLDSIGAGLASAYVAEGRTEPLKTRLLPLYERMVAALPADSGPWMLGFTLGQQLADTDLPRARALVEAARPRAAVHADKKPEPLAEIDAWLAKHPAPK